MIVFLKIIFNILIVGLFLYSKLLPYKDRLKGKYLGVFSFFERLFEPLLNALRYFVQPINVGTNLFVDMAQIVFLLFLLLINGLLG